MTKRMNPFNGARVFRTEKTIFIPIPGDLCVQEERNIGCSCGFCDGDGLWDTIAIRAKPEKAREPFGHAWTVHHPELRDVDFAERRAMATESLRAESSRRLNEGIERPDGRTVHEESTDDE